MRVARGPPDANSVALVRLPDTPWRGNAADVFCLVARSAVEQRMSLGPHLWHTRQAPPPSSSRYRSSMSIGSH